MASSWLKIPPGCGFPIENLPYGIFSTKTLDARIGVAIGEYILDLKALAKDENIFASINFDISTLEQPTLNAFASLDKQIHRDVRQKLQDFLLETTSTGATFRDNPERRMRVLVPQKEAVMHLPMTIGDYTDFCVGINHFQNCNDIFRPGSTLPPNFLNLPVGYHGRASSVVISGTPVQRPKGQILVDGSPTYDNSRKLDFEVEFAAFIGRGNEMGDEIQADDAEDHIFGVVLMNDWSARDIQEWESVPLGPFNGKNFCTTVSPWIVTLEALEPFRTTPIRTDAQLLPYLNQNRKDTVFDIPIEVFLTANNQNHPISLCNTKHVIFSLAQMLAHHTVGGCPMRTGDLIATGTLSGPTREELGCLLEITRNGKESIEMNAKDASSDEKVVRTFLLDGDTVEFDAKVEHKDGYSVGFGTCVGTVLSSKL